MCGITGSVNWGDSQSLAAMTQLLVHRGPDDSGTWQYVLPDGTWVGLGNRRLSIRDLSPAGHMPMQNDDATLWITYNGELYNATPLRTELEGKGHRFRSNSDTEVVLRMYEQYGPECVKRLDGMFAIAISDLRRQQLFLARDHFGVKPLYYAHQGAKFAFASEIKALLTLPGFKRTLSLDALDQYLTFLWVPDPLTMFEGVLKLPAAHYGIFKQGKFTLEQYWDLTFPAAGHAYTLSEDEIVEELRARLRHSVEEQMVSDVPIGAFLSAGMDSSSIVAMMSQASRRPVRTYTITFPEK